MAVLEKENPFCFRTRMHVKREYKVSILGKILALFHFIRIRVGSHSLATHTSDNIDITTIVLETLLGTATWLFLLVFLCFNLGCLTLHLTGTC
jgi:hypothetical protein